MRYLIALSLLTACYMRGHPAAGITPEFAQNWNCDAAAVRAAADTMKAKTADDRFPKRGWTACDVMASIGNPDATNLSRNGGETIATWCYINYAGAAVHQVILVRRDNAWIVDAATRWGAQLSVGGC